MNNNLANIWNKNGGKASLCNKLNVNKNFEYHCLMKRHINGDAYELCEGTLMHCFIPVKCSILFNLSINAVNYFLFICFLLFLFVLLVFFVCLLFITLVITRIMFCQNWNNKKRISKVTLQFQALCTQIWKTLNRYKWQ